MKTKVFIYEDNRDRREGLLSLLHLAPNIECVGAEPDCSTIEFDLKRTLPNIVLMDIDMPNVNGIEGLKIIKKQFPTIKVLMQTVFEENEKIFESLKYGAEGYILKKEAPQKIIDAIEEILSGGAMMTPSIAMKVMAHFKQQQNLDTTIETLTDKEREVLKYLSEGYSYKMAAAEMTISYSTVNSHIKHIYEKLQVHSMGEAISIALKNKWYG